MIAIRIVVLCSLLFIVAGCGSSDDIVSGPAGTTSHDVNDLDGGSASLSCYSLWHFDCDYLDACGPNHGTPEGPMGFSTTVVHDGACSVDLQGEGARVIFDPGLLNLEVATIEAWIYPTSGEVDPTASSGIFWDKSTIAGVGNGGFRVTFNHPNQVVRIQIDDNPGAGATVDFQCPIPLNAWTHVAVSWDGNSVWLYKNCALVGQAALASHPFGSARVSFGAAQDGGDDFDGYMDEVRLTPGATSPSDPGCGLSVALDIKPGSCPNPINQKSKGTLPVAILGTAEFDVLDIDVSSLLLEGVAPIRSSVEDVTTPFVGDECDCTEEGPDGYDDLTLKFNTQEIIAAIAPVARGDEKVLTISGTLLDGTPFEGTDCVVVVGGNNEWIVFARDNDVWRVRPNGSDIERVVDLPAGARVRGIALSPDASRLAYVEYYSEFSASNRLVLVDIDGSNPQTLVLTGGNGASGVCDFHPDGTRVMYYRDISPGGGQNYELYEVALDSTLDVNLTNHPNNDGCGTYSPTGDQITFASGSAFCSACVDIYTQNHNGTGRKEIFDLGGDSDNTPMWSPDGTRILISSRYPGDQEDLYLIDPDGSNPVQLTNTFGVRERQKAWSPDGNRIVFERSGNLYFIDRDGGGEVFFLNNATWPDWAGGAVVGGKNKRPFEGNHL